MLQLTQELFGAEDPDIARLGDDQSMFDVLAGFHQLLHGSGRASGGRTPPVTWRR